MPPYNPSLLPPLKHPILGPYCVQPFVEGPPKMDGVTSKKPQGNGNIFTPLYSTYLPHTIPRCASCGTEFPSMQSLLSHMFGQGAAGQDGVKAACANFLAEHAYFLDIERTGNTLYAKERVGRCHKGAPLNNVIPEDVLDEMAYRTFVARAQIDDCNFRDPLEMRYISRPAPNVPSHIMKQYIFDADATASLCSLHPHFLQYVEDWRQGMRLHIPAVVARALADMRSRIEFEGRVRRYASRRGLSYELELYAGTGIFNPVEADFSEKWEQSQNRGRPNKKRAAVA